MSAYNVAPHRHVSRKDIETGNEKCLDPSKEEKDVFLGLYLVSISSSPREGDDMDGTHVLPDLRRLDEVVVLTEMHAEVGDTFVDLTRRPLVLRWRVRMISLRSAQSASCLRMLASHGPLGLIVRPFGICDF